MNRAAALERKGCWAGLVALVLIAAGFFVVDGGGSEPPDAPVPILVREITDNRGRIVAGSMLGMLGALLLVWFSAAIRSRLGREGDDGDVLGRVASSFVAVMAMGALLHGSFRLACATVDDPNTLAEAARPLAVLKEHVTDVLGFGVVGLALSLCAATFVCRLLPTAMAYTGAAFALATLALMPTNHGGVGIVLFVWLVVACSLLLGSTRDHVPEPTVR